MTDPQPSPPSDPPAPPADAWWDEPNSTATPSAPAAPAEAAPSAEPPAPTDATPPAGLETVPPAAALPEAEGTRALTDADEPHIAVLRSRQGLAAAALRDVGRVRSINQDSVFALITTLPRESNDLSMGLFIVADGMGGHDSGEVASRLAISAVARQVLSELVAPALIDQVNQALQPLIISAVQEANRAIWEHARSIGSDMGTTCTAALLIGHALYLGHVGDSRAYLLTPGGLRPITADHSAVGRLIQLGQLDPAEAREHPLRSQLYRTVGQQPEIPVDFVSEPISDATHLLLCSDGLWSMIDDEVIRDVLEHNLWPHDACRELIARANLAGGDDNISAVVVTLPQAP